MRKRLYEIIEPFKGNDKISTAYDIMMIIAIVMSIIPLAFRETNTFFYCTDIITTILFVIDYIFRFITADYRCYQNGKNNNNDIINPWYCNRSVTSWYNNSRLYGRHQFGEERERKR